MVNESQVQEGASEHPPDIPDSLVAEARGTFSSSDGAQPPSDKDRTASRAVEPDQIASGDFAKYVHTYTTEYIKLADQKAAFVFAMNAALLCYFFKNDLHKMWLAPLSTWVVLDFACLVSMFALGIGLLFACATIIPMLRKSHAGIVFFNSVAIFKSGTEYASEVISTLPIHLARALLRHNYDLACVCRSKYRQLAVALWSTSLGVVLGLAVLLLTK